VSRILLCEVVLWPEEDSQRKKWLPCISGVAPAHGHWSDAGTAVAVFVQVQQSALLVQRGGLAGGETGCGTGSLCVCSAVEAMQFARVEGKWGSRVCALLFRVCGVAFT
jgi:hypothetical protein